MQIPDVNFLSAESGLFMTGTDTGIGKTFVSCALLRSLRASGRRVQAMKPVASGCEWADGRWRNDDALALMTASDSTAEYATVNPYALPLPTAPQIAAKQAGVMVELPVMQQAFMQLGASADFVLVEGVGGWLAPLGADLDQSDLVHALQIPVLLVVGMRLGCINHARLSEQSILASGCRLLGWIGNAVEGGFDSDGAYFKALAGSLHSPCLGRMPFSPA
jgi:dethiobiotin synthetase